MDPWHVVVVLASAMGTAIGVLWRAFLKGDLVPGSIYRDAVARAEKAEAQEERNTKAILALNATVKAATERRERAGHSGG